MPTIELSEKPRSPNSSPAASRILRSVRSPRGVRGALPLATPDGALSSTFTPMRLPYRCTLHSQVETRFNCHYGINLTADAMEGFARGRTRDCAFCLHSPHCSALLPARRVSPPRLQPSLIRRCPHSPRQQPRKCRTTP